MNFGGQFQGQGQLGLGGQGHNHGVHPGHMHNQG